MRNSPSIVLAKKSRVDGILLLDKPCGPSSNQALQLVKRLYGALKAGHAGTLDPLASGLLPVLFGEATKFSSYLLDSQKAYKATIQLGIRTTTGDVTGEVLERRPVEFSEAALASAVAALVGPMLQVPPMHSALKRGGVPLYRLARRGEVVEREPRSIVIYALSVERIAGGEVDIAVRCSKGTYIRVLAEDIGSRLGCGGAIKHLRRTAVGAFDVARASTLEDLEASGPAVATSFLLPVDAGLQHLPMYSLSHADAVRIGQGQAVEAADACLLEEAPSRVYDVESGRFLGLACFRDGVLQPLRLVLAGDHENDLRQP
jgi:tRNA pseudouridine55 synthase